MVICLERGADLHMAQLMPLPLTVSCFSKIQIGFTCPVPAHLGSPGQRAIKWVCVCAVSWKMHQGGVMLLQKRNSWRIKFVVAFALFCVSIQEALCGPRATRCVGSKCCQLLHNSVGTTFMTSPEQIDVMELEGYSRPTYNKLAHSGTTRSTIVGVIHKLTVDEFVGHTSSPKTWCGAIF